MSTANWKIDTSIPSLAIAPPPTPNGGLHVGHLSGPYLYADVYRRFHQARGREISFPLHVDLNQSYVETAAHRQNLAPMELARRATAHILDAFELARIGITAHGEVDRADYAVAINQFFRGLAERDAIVPRTVVLPTAADGRPISEAWVNGHCPTCLAHTCGGICETCGRPNGHRDLLAAQEAASGNALGADGAEGAEVNVFVLPLEAFRAQLTAHFEPLYSRLRPTLRTLLQHLFAGPLPEVAVTLPASWGCRCEFAFGDQVFNPWLELLPGHILFSRDTPHPWTSSRAPILFFGFDNSFYYTLVHTALLLGYGGEYALPEHYVTNEFYELGATKFSTSLNHVIWVSDLLREVSADAARYYVARTNPTYQRSSFDPSGLEELVDVELLGPLQALIADRQALDDRADHDPDDALALGPFFARLERLYAPDTLDLRAIAVALSSCLCALHSLYRPAPQAARTRSQRALDRALALWSEYACPIVPETGEALLRALRSSPPSDAGLASALTHLRRKSS